MLVLAATAAAVGFFTPPTLADGRNPGSTLIYPVHRSGDIENAGGESNSYFTIISVTNTNTNPVDGHTLVHYEYANGIPDPDEPFLSSGWTVFDRIELLTPTDTLSVLTSCHNATSPQGMEGFLAISAQDPDQFNVAWAFDYLIGSEFVINRSGGMYSVNAVPFEARQAAGDPTDVNGNGRLDFDDVEYEGIPDVLYIDSFVAVAGSQLALVNLTGTAQDTNMVQFTVWNDNEFPLSAQVKFNCWFDQPLTTVSPLFHNYFLQQSTPHDSSELDVTCNGVNNYETGWARIDSLGVRNAGGTLIDPDGALLGCITGAGDRTFFDGGHLLWESTDKQLNGSY
jgi:hypothetical protein